jgi:hypothetical protein
MQTPGGNPPSGNAFFLSRLIYIILVSILIIFNCWQGLTQVPCMNSRTGFPVLQDSSLAEQVKRALKLNSRKLQFVENNGQEGLPANVIGYFSSAYEMVFIERNRLRIVVWDKTQPKSTANHAHYASGKAYTGIGKTRYTSFCIFFKGANSVIQVNKQNPFSTIRNFLQSKGNGRQPISALSYAELSLLNIYPGIDLRLYSQDNGHLEFDWIIWPGADPGKIKMDFSGNQQVSLSREGNLRINLKHGFFNIHLPESYYVTSHGKIKTNARFIISGWQEVSFILPGEKYPAYPLVIDPDLLWGSFFDGNNTNFDEYLYAIQLNTNNDLIYCAGAANRQVSTSYAAALSLAYDSTFADSTDAFIYAFTKNGQFIKYITYLGGMGADVATGLSVSSSWIYICGHTSSPDFPVTRVSNGGYPAFDSLYHGNVDGFVAVFKPSLDSLNYCSYLGGNGADKALTIRAVADSVFYISLSVMDTLSLSSPNYIYNYADSVYAGNSEAWIGKFSRFNFLNFGTYVGGTSDDLINDFQVLGNGDVVFAGNTKEITEVNPRIPDNGSGQEALFGKIKVPASGPVSFDIIDKIGGSGSDFGWGIYNLGDSISYMVGETNSADFPLGSGPVFQNTRMGKYDGFIAKIYNDGSPGYKATFTGGSGNDILVSVRPVVLNQRALILGFGSTNSNDLLTRNYNGGTFFSANNSGGLDMMFVICDMDLTNKYYLSYIGGSANDYLGITGAPVGSNHLCYSETDSALYVGTTTHSSQLTQTPLFVGRGPADVLNIHVPVFDSTKGNSNNDTHVVIAISTGELYAILQMHWLDFTAALLQDCSVRLIWQVSGNESLSYYIIQRSDDGKNFINLGEITSSGNSYIYTDQTGSLLGKKTYYRIAAVDRQGKILFSPVQSVRPCDLAGNPVLIFPTVIKDEFFIGGLGGFDGQKLDLTLLDAAGRITERQQITGSFFNQAVYIREKLAADSYLITVTDAASGTLIISKKVLVGF